MSGIAVKRKVRSPLIAWCTLVVVGSVAFGTLLPLNFDHGLGEGGFSEFVWGGSPVSDIVTNVCVYLPVGGMLFLYIAHNRRRTILAVLAAGALGLMMSVGLEWLQTMLPMRVASWTDVCMNVGGTLGGGIAAMIALRLGKLRSWILWGLRARPLSAAATAVTLGLIAYHLLPFDVVTSSAALFGSLRESRLGFSLHGQGASSWLAWAGYAGQFALVGFLSVHAFMERGRSLRRSVAESIQHVAVVALVLEVVQIFVVSHTFDVMDGVAGVVGGGTGVAIARCLVGWRRVPSLRSALTIVLACEVSYLLLVSATPFDLSWAHVELSRLNALPFLTYFMRPFGAAAGALSQTVLTYGVLAMAAWFVLGDAPRSIRVFGVVACTVGVASGCEVLQMLTGGRHPDVTDPLIAMGLAIAVSMIEPARVPVLATSGDSPR